MKLTKSNIDKISAPTNTNQAFYRDPELRGFALRITSNGVKSFIVEKAINGQVRRITIGCYGELTPEQARKLAQKYLGEIASGTDPIAKKQTEKMQCVTLAETFADYLKVRKSLKKKTLYDYQRVMNIAFVAYQNKSLTSLTKDKVEKLHQILAEKHGTAYANLAMRVLRALFNFAIAKYEDSNGCALIAENPVIRLSQARAWYRVERRQTYIKPHELANWYQALNQLENQTLKDYLLLLLFTGLRRQEAAKLTWTQIDFIGKTLTVIDTKNHLDHSLPLSDYLYNLLFNRYQTSSSLYVFPGTGQDGYIIEPRRQIAKIIQTSNISFTIHDLRRTFITISESLDISAYAVNDW